MKSVNPLAIVTGASRGIGRSLVRKLEQEGFSVLAIARSFRGDRPGPDTRRMNLDLLEPDALTKIQQRLEDYERPIDLFVNNAGVQYEIDLTRLNDPDVADLAASELQLNLSVPVMLAGRLSRMSSPVRVTLTPVFSSWRRSLASCRSM